MSATAFPLRALADPHRPPSQVVLPHRPGVLAPLLPLRVERALLDGRPDVEFSAERRTIDLGGRVDWRSLRVEFSLPDVAHPLLRRCFPQALGAGEEPPLHFRLLVRCPRTRLRRSAPFRPAGNGRGYAAALEIESDAVAGRVTVEAVCVLAEPRARFGEEPPTRGEAWALHSLIARSPLWRIVPDSGRPPPSEGIETIWIDFARPGPKGPYDGRDDARLRAAPHALFHLVLRATDGPLLLLNENSRALKRVLLSRGRRGLKARVRDALLERIAVAAWRTLLAEAVRELGGPEDAEEWSAAREDHWTARAIESAAAALELEAEDLLLGLAPDAEGRLGLLFQAAETLGKIGRHAADRLAREVEGA